MLDWAMPIRIRRSDLDNHLAHEGAMGNHIARIRWHLLREGLSVQERDRFTAQLAAAELRLETMRAEHAAAPEHFARQREFTP